MKIATLTQEEFESKTDKYAAVKSTVRDLITSGGSGAVSFELEDGDSEQGIMSAARSEATKHGVSISIRTERETIMGGGTEAKAVLVTLKAAEAKGEESK